MADARFELLPAETCNDTVTATAEAPFTYASAIVSRLFNNGGDKTLTPRLNVAELRDPSDTENEICFDAALPVLKNVTPRSADWYEAVKAVPAKLQIPVAESKAPVMPLMLTHPNTSIPLSKP